MTTPTDIPDIPIVLCTDLYIGRTGRWLSTDRWSLSVSLYRRDARGWPTQRDDELFELDIDVAVRMWSLRRAPRHHLPGLWWFAQHVHRFTPAPGIDLDALFGLAALEPQPGSFRFVTPDVAQRFQVLALRLDAPGGPGE